MSEKTKIKREDIISDKALNFGKNYAISVEKAIKANERLIKSIKKLKKILK